MSQYKRCAKCSQTLSAQSFSKSKNNKDGLVSYCKSCVRTYNKSYHAKNFEKIAKQTASYRARNSENISSWNQNYYQNNKDYYATKAKSWRERNAESKKAYDKKYQSQNRDKAKAASKRYALRFPEVISLKRQARRATLKDAKRYLVLPKDLAKILRRPCIYCGKQSEHVDHVMPLSKGGSHSIGNLVGACKGCNLSKGSKFLSQWRYGKQIESKNEL